MNTELKQKKTVSFHQLFPGVLLKAVEVLVGLHDH